MIDPVIVCLVGLLIYEALAQSAGGTRTVKLQQRPDVERCWRCSFYSKKSLYPEHI